jgi:hypothetical protein
MAAFAILNLSIDTFAKKFYADIARRGVGEDKVEVKHPLIPSGSQKSRGGFANSWR